MLIDSIATRTGTLPSEEISVKQKEALKEDHFCVNKIALEKQPLLSLGKNTMLDQSALKFLPAEGSIKRDRYFHANKQPHRNCRLQDTGFDVLLMFFQQVISHLGNGVAQMRDYTFLPGGLAGK